MLDLPPASIAIMSCGAVKKVELIVSLSEDECFVKGVGASKLEALGDFLTNSNRNV